MLTGIRFHMKDFNSTGFPLHKINKFLQGIFERTGRVVLIAFRFYGFYSIRIDKPSVGPCTVGMVYEPEFWGNDERVKEHKDVIRGGVSWDAGFEAVGPEKVPNLYKKHCGPTLPDYL